MVQGIALHIGINHVDNNGYGVQVPPLFACENDAIALKQITDNNGFKSTLLLSPEATTINIISHIKESAKQLKSGDTFLLSYSGHGSQIKDNNGDEEDEKDEFFVTYDKPLFDDELHFLFPLFAENVRVIIIADCCHSGTITRSVKGQSTKGKVQRLNRNLSSEISQDIFADKRKFNQLKNRLAKLTNNQKEIKAGIISLSACNDKQLAAEGKNYGAFTESLLKLVTKNQKPKKGEKPKRLTPSYLINETKLLLKGKNQTPQLNKHGIIPRSFLLQDVFQLTDYKGIKFPKAPKRPTPSQTAGSATRFSNSSI
ncbi:caspase family protein [Geminocystis sp. GBBB08]|uniref:caspase family protein n=1 Tax=Geminocystis sp. GBBB08 TaxID=2604140 RepID=UPI0027E34775|nr:caspase family protein [Geminocystis sp. GBBB08]MBL1208259.1 caspase family protein [Geminocystis sp. GBBB08]